MKQINGPGSLVCGICVLGAAVCAECIPLMIGFATVAVLGYLFDVLNGNYVEIKKSPRRAGTRSRRKTNYIKLSIQQSREKGKGEFSNARI